MIANSLMKFLTYIKFHEFVLYNLALIANITNKKQELQKLAKQIKL